MKDSDFDEICQKIKNLVDIDLLLLCTVAESFPRTSREIQFRFNKKFQEEFNQTAERNTINHRLRYLQLIKLLTLKDGEGFELTFPIDVLINIGLISGMDNTEERRYSWNEDNDKEYNDINEHDEATDKLQALLEKDDKKEKDECKDGWKYLTNKKLVR